MDTQLCFTHLNDNRPLLSLLETRCNPLHDALSHPDAPEETTEMSEKPQALTTPKDLAARSHFHECSEKIVCHMLQLVPEPKGTTSTDLWHDDRPT